MNGHVAIVVEGPHDGAFLAAILRAMRFEVVDDRQSLPPKLSKLLPSKPPDDHRLGQRKPVPRFFARDGAWCTVHYAQGRATVGDTLSGLIGSIELHGVGTAAVATVVDADGDAIERVAGEVLRGVGVPTDLPLDASWAVRGEVAWGLYVLPDHGSPGSLEHILMEAAEVTWPSVVATCETTVATVATALQDDDKKLLNKPFGSQKATCAVLGAVLKPGMAIQNSIEQTRWVRAAVGRSAKVDAVAAFIDGGLARIP